MLGPDSEIAHSEKECALCSLGIDYLLNVIMRPNVRSYKVSPLSTQTHTYQPGLHVRVFGLTCGRHTPTSSVYVTIFDPADDLKGGWPIGDNFVFVQRLRHHDSPTGGPIDWPSPTKEGFSTH
jgi:hypothetical protein